MRDQAVDALDQAWDARVTNRDVDSTLIDPSIDEVVRRFHAAADVDGADPAFVDHLWENLMSTEAAAIPLTQPPDRGVVPWRRPLGRRRTVTRPTGESDSRRLARFLLNAAAAILLILISVGATYRLTNRGDGEPSKGGPAIHAPATPEPDPETLLEITLPAGEIPSGAETSGGLAVWTVPPGTRSSWADTCCPGPYLQYIVEGTLSMRSEAAVTVIRAAGSAEEAPAGTEITLAAGDTVLTRNEVPHETANDGTEPVLLLSFTFIEDPGYGFGGHMLTGWRNGDRDLQFDLELKAEPVTLRLSRTTVQSGETIAPDDQAVRRHAVTTVHGPFLDQASDGTIEVLAGEGETVPIYLLTLTQEGSEATPQP